MTGVVALSAGSSFSLAYSPPLVGIRLYLVHIPIQLPPVEVDLKAGHGEDARLVMEVQAGQRPI